MSVPKFTVEVVTREAVKIVGLKVRTSMQTSEVDCPALWQESFGPRMSEVATYPGLSYGASVMVDQDKFDYLAALPYREGDPIPEGMGLLDLAAGPYAECEVESLADLAGAYQYIFFGWGAGEMDKFRADAVSYELYPADHCASGRLTLYMPLKVEDKT